MHCPNCGFEIDELNESQPVCPSCGGTDPYDPSQRFVGGGLLGAASGAAIGAAAGGGHGAALGARTVRDTATSAAIVRGLIALFPPWARCRRPRAGGS